MAALLATARPDQALSGGLAWVTAQPDPGRGARLTEQVELLRRLWSEPLLDYDGRFHRVDRAGILPQPGRIPIWFGGFSEPALR